MNLALRDEIARGDMASAALRALDASVSTAVGDAYFSALASALGSVLRLRAVAVLVRRERTPETWFECVVATAAGAPITVAPVKVDDPDSETHVEAHSEPLVRVDEAQAHPLGRAVVAALTDALTDTPPADPRNAAANPSASSLPDRAAGIGVRSPLLVATLRAEPDDAPIGALVLVGDGPFDDRLGPELLLRSQLDRAAAELARRNADARLRMVVDGAVDMISVHAPSGAYVYASPSCEALLGYRPDELIGHSAYDFMDSRDIATVGNVHHEVLTLAGQVRVQYALRHKDGRRIRVESQTQAVRDADGAITDLVVITRDVTDRHVAHEGLLAERARLDEENRRLAAEKESVERRWHAVCEKLNDYVVIVDPDMRIVYINRTLPDTTVDAVVGTTVDEHLDPGHDHALELTREVIRTGKPQRTEFESVGPIGRVRWAATIWPLVEDGAIRGAISIVRDLRGEREVESALTESERRYRILFEESPEGLLVHDGDRVRMANRRVAELLGYPDPAKLIGVPVLNLVEASVRPVVRQRIAELLRGTAIQPRMRQTLLRFDGSTIDLEVAARACTYQGRPAVQTSMRPVGETLRS